MPSYIYKCKNCEYQFETFHSVTENLHNCDNCNNSESLERIPQLLTSYARQKTNREAAGQRVERFIEDTRKILLESKEELKNKEYK